MKRLPVDISAFTLKVAAIVGMTCNHVANAQLVQSPLLYALGGLTFPIMAFLLTEGYVHTSNVKRYALRLLVFALIAQVPWTLLWGFDGGGNVLFTLLISLGLLWVRDQNVSRETFFALFAVGLAISYLCDWGVVGPLLVYLFHIMQDRSVVIPMFVPYATVVPAALANGSIGELGYALFGFTLACILITGYRGRRGRSLKWFFYAYYPLHLLAIWLLKCFT